MPIFDKVPKKMTQVDPMSSRGYFRRTRYYHPVVAGNTDILAAVTLPTSGTTTSTTFVAQPDFARTINLKANQATAQVSVIINGTDIRGTAITETVAIGSYSSATASTKAFKTITSIVFPTRGGASDTVSVGYGPKLGLDRICAGNEVLMGTVDGVLEATAPVISINATDISKNLVLFNTALAVTKTFVVNYVATEVTSDSHVI